MPEPKMPIPASWFRREWVCKAHELEGYVPCTAEDQTCNPHYWGCGYYWRASFSDQRWNTLQKRLRMEQGSCTDSGE